MNRSWGVRSCFHPAWRQHSIRIPQSPRPVPKAHLGVPSELLRPQACPQSTSGLCWGCLNAGYKPEPRSCEFSVPYSPSAHTWEVWIPTAGAANFNSLLPSAELCSVSAEEGAEEGSGQGWVISVPWELQGEQGCWFALLDAATIIYY